VPYDDFIEALKSDTREYAPLLKIVAKNEETITLKPNDGQLEFEQRLQEQQAEGKPLRAIILKARKTGFSTWVQAKMIQRTTLRQNHRAIVVAHDKKTAGELFEIGKTMYANLPEEPLPDGTPLKPPIRYSSRNNELHFAQPERDAWLKGDLWPNSRYSVDTANELQSGRGMTPHSLHASEVAFYPNAEKKMTALKNAVGSGPNTMIVLESTADGHNWFKEQWDLAEAGESPYIPFFWPWWKDKTYTRPFLSQSERDRFIVGEGRWGEDEPMLIERFELTLEQLNWRRATIADECSGSPEVFKVEFPSYPEEAFLGTGRRVFDQQKVAELRELIVLEHDPPGGEGGPLRGVLRAAKQRTMETINGSIEIPTEARWVPYTDLELGEQSPWKLWVPIQQGKPQIPAGPKVIGVDVSGGEVEAENAAPAFHAIEVVDHQTGDQIAEYVSKVDPKQLAYELVLTALTFGWEPENSRGPMIAVERTGGWGMPVVRALWYDYHYPFVYRSKPIGRTHEKQEKRLGWETSPRTKPDLLALGQELLRTETTGIKSLSLVSEMGTYVRNEKGRTMPEPGKFSDRLMAWLIAQTVRRQQPVMLSDDDDEPAPGWRPRDPVSGY
jgi:hypothetical protein